MIINELLVGGEIMKLAIFSDSHGYGDRIKQVVESLSDIDYILYAGDVLKDLDAINVPKGVELVAVKGNCDYRTEYPEDRVINIDESKIFLTHGHKYNIKRGLDRLYYKARELDSNIVIFGHTHCRCAIEEDGILFFNPGSISIPRDGKKASYGLVEINNSIIKYKHIDFA